MNLSCTYAVRAISIALLVHVIPVSFAATYDQMVVFGDSLSDNGNVSTILGPGVLPALNYDSSRFTNGPATTPATSIVGVAVEQLNQLLGLPSLAPSILGGNDYAWANATTGFETLDPARSVTPGTGTQVNTYLSSHPQASPDSLYVLWAGANDLFNGTTTAGIQANEATAIDNLSSQITALLDAGAKNILWFNLPDLSLTPAGRLRPSALTEQLHLSSLEFQLDWTNSISSFRTLYPDANITGVDTFAFINSVVADPTAYGFTNVTGTAQNLAGVNPDEYLFWDATHPTTKAYQALAGYAADQLSIAAVPEVSSSACFGILILGIILRRIWISKKPVR